MPVIRKLTLFVIVLMLMFMPAQNLAAYPDAGDERTDSPAFEFPVHWSDAWEVSGDGFRTPDEGEAIEEIELVHGEFALTIEVFPVAEDDPQGALDAAVQRYLAGNPEPGEYPRITRLNDGTVSADAMRDGRAIVIDAKPLKGRFVTLVVTLEGPTSGFSEVLDLVSETVWIDHFEPAMDASSRRESDRENPDETGITGNEYESRTFGFHLSWQVDEWYVLSEAREPTGDVLVLRNAAFSTIMLEPREWDGDDLVACVEDEWAPLDHTGHRADIGPAQGEDGVDLAGATDTAAWGVFTYVDLGDHGESLGEVVAYTECRVLYDDAILVMTVSVIQADRFDEEIASAFRVVETITLTSEEEPMPLSVPAEELVPAP